MYPPQVIKKCLKDTNHLASSDEKYINKPKEQLGQFLIFCYISYILLFFFNELLLFSLSTNLYFLTVKFMPVKDRDPQKSKPLMWPLKGRGLETLTSVSLGTIEVFSLWGHSTALAPSGQSVDYANLSNIMEVKTYSDYIHITVKSWGEKGL